MEQINVIIPALNPDKKLIALIRDFIDAPELMQKIRAFIIVDDGSDSSHQSIFTQLQQLPLNNLTILHHTHNRGKGAALKTGFQYVTNRFRSCNDGF
ncbi:glycosyltransferase [Lactiplantibacillus pentosus]